MRELRSLGSVRGVLRKGHSYREPRYGNERLEPAYARALQLQAIGYHYVRNILEKGLETADLPEQGEPSAPLSHDNVRGPVYYAGGAS